MPCGIYKLYLYLSYGGGNHQCPEGVPLCKSHALHLGGRHASFRIVAQEKHWVLLAPLVLQ